MAATKLEDKLYNCVPQDLFNLLESLNNQATQFKWSEKFDNIMIPRDVSDTNTDYVN